MTLQQLIDILQANGWRLTKEENETRQFKHDSVPLPVTLTGKLNLLVPAGVLRTIRRNVRSEEDSDALRGNL